MTVRISFKRAECNTAHFSRKWCFNCAPMRSAGPYPTHHGRPKPPRHKRIKGRRTEWTAKMFLHTLGKSPKAKRLP